MMTPLISALLAALTGYMILFMTMFALLLAFQNLSFSLNCLYVITTHCVFSDRDRNRTRPNSKFSSRSVLSLGEFSLVRSLCTGLKPINVSPHYLLT